MKKSAFSFTQLQKKSDACVALRAAKFGRKRGEKGDFRRSTLSGQRAKFRRKRDSNLASTTKYN